MPIISKAIIDEIKARCDIADVIGAHIPLKRAGATFKGLCPFHKEKTPSFNVNPQRQIFHCFGCHEGGDVFSFIMRYEGVDFSTAARMLAQKAGIALEFSDEERKDRTDKDLLFKILGKAADLYQRNLLEHPAAEPARAYLKKRGLDGDPARIYQLGYALNDSRAMLKWGRAEGFSGQHLELVGLTGKGESGDAYDRFRDRLMFPIRDELGRVVGFSGRIMDPAASPAKYINTPETALFKKSRVLYGLDKARHRMVDQRRAILCEGQIDVIRCHLAGVENTVAPQGTALTEDHIRLLKRYADSVVMVFDADSAGKNAALRSAALILREGLNVSLAELPEGEDPDSMIVTHGAEAFLDVLQRAKSVIDFQIDHLGKTHDPTTDEGRRRLAQSVLELAGSVPSEIQREQILSRASQRLGISENALRTDLGKLSRRRYTHSSEQPEPSSRPTHPPEETALLEWLIHDPGHCAFIFDYIRVDDLADPVCRTLFEWLFQRPDPAEALSLDELPRDNPECARLAAAIMAKSRVGSADEFSPAEAAQHLILRIRRKGLEKKREELRVRIPNVPEKEKENLLLECKVLTQDIAILKKGWKDAEPILSL